MTPDQIIPGHTYRLADGRATRIESIRDGYVFHRELSGSLAMPAVVFASLCVRDITPAPVSPQGEKVAQAQSQGPSRGDGCGPVRKFAIDVADFLRYAGYSGATDSPAGRLLRQAREIAQEPPYAAAVNAELLGSLKDIVETVERVDAGVYRDCVDSARAAIARAEAVQ